MTIISRFENSLKTVSIVPSSELRRWTEIVPAVEPADEGDVESPPWTWDAWTDADVWTTTDEDPELGVDGGDDHIDNEFIPTDEDLAEANEMFRAMEARDHLDRPAMSLLELIRHNEAFYREWPTDAGTLIADTLAALADRVQGVQATTPAELHDREEILAEDMDPIDCYRAAMREPFSITREEAARRLQSNWTSTFSAVV